MVENKEMPLVSETDKKEEVITQTDKKEEVVTQTDKKEEVVILTDKKEDQVINEMSIKKQVETMLQSGQSVNESENRISTLKGILTFLQKKDGQVSESSDDICKIDGMENTEQSVQENQNDQRDKRNDPVYKLHVHVDSGNENDNDVKSVVAEIVDKVIHKIDNEE